MNNFKTWLSGTASRLARAFPLALLACLPAVSAAALTDIAREPLATYVSVKTKPNILFVLDNSGSMGWDFMPDDLNANRNNASDKTYQNTYGYKSAHCNGVAFDPDFTYTPPVKADGTLYPDASFTAASPNGYGPSFEDGKAYYSDSAVTTSGGSKTFVFTGGFFAGLENMLDGIPAWKVGDTITAVDVEDENHWVIGTITKFESTNPLLCFIYCKATVTINVTSFKGAGSASDWQVNKLKIDSLAGSTYFTYNGSQPRMAWTYTASGADDTLFKRECLSRPGNPANEAGDGKFSGVILTVNSPAPLKQNYANWYQYYSTRMLMMRSASGRAFQPLSNRYRIGFTTINSPDITERSAMKDISAGKAFLHVRDYDNAQRELFLERLYNTSANGGTPLRTALSRAGRYYAKKATSTQSYDPVQYACQRNYTFLSTDGYWNDGSNPKQLNGTTDIGQQDGADVRPFTDGGAGTRTTVVKKTERKETLTPIKADQVYQRTVYSYGTQGSGGCTSTRWPEIATPQNTTTTASGNRVLVEDWVSTTTTADAYNMGALTSSSNVSGPVSTTVSDTQLNPPAPSGGETWTPTTPVTTTCVSTSSKRTGSSLITTPAKFGPVVLSATGVATTVTLSTTISDPTTTVVGGAGGVSNTLADVAEYYYNTDLRTAALDNCTPGAGGSGDVCDNAEIRASGRDTALWQHMTTFTLGLGVNGTIAYDPAYLDRSNDATSSYYKLIKGTLDWPAPLADKATTIDDLWHAAVNGRGQYFGAKNATELTNGLKVALSSMSKVPGSGSAVGASAIQAGGSALAFASSYATVDWTGDISPYTVLTNGTLSALSGNAQAGVDNLAWRGGRTADERNIYYRKPSTTTLQSFDYTNLNADGLGASFINLCSKSVSDSSTLAPAQCTTLNADQKLIANNGTALVNWLRGHSAYEETNLTNPIFRTRISALGDIVNSTPTYVGPPSQMYGDSGYAAYKTAQKDRKPVVYVGANDGMLHAFSAATADMGKELWAFVPTAVMPNMFRLANSDYANHHQFLVDGSPAIADIEVGGAWKTILVAGLNSGGKGIYALDITNPTSPKVLWEFTDTDLGYTYGKPVITKRANGTWVAVFASGYNNSGNGYLYVRNAYTGAQEIAKIPTNTGGVDGVGGTPVGTATTPSGLARINAWIDSTTDNTARRFYGGDLLGNLWRFDINESATTPYGRAQRLGYFQVNASTPQPIMVRPSLAEVTYNNVKYPVVAVGTGRYLGQTDVSDATQQSIYAIKDPLTMTDAGNLRGNAQVVAQTVTTDVAGDYRSISTNAVDWSSKLGWRVDLQSNKERTTADMLLQYNTLVVGTGVPGPSSTCSASGGTGWLYYLNIATGGNVPGSVRAGTVVKGGLVTGLTWFERSGDGKESSGAEVTDSGGGSTSINIPTESGGEPGKLRRASWRELFNN